MNDNNRLDPVKLLDMAARASRSSELESYQFYVIDRGRALGVLLDLQALGWRIDRPEREAMLGDNRRVRVLVPDAHMTCVRGHRIAGFLADEDVALTFTQRMALMPAMVGNAKPAGEGA